MNFLLIDNSKPFRDAACLLIDREGHYPQPADSGEAGLNLLKHNKFDAVFANLKLQNENGLDVLRQITKTNAGLPVVMFSDEGAIENAVEAMRLGAAHVLEKPFGRQQFQLALAALEGFSQMHRKMKRLKKETTETKSSVPDLLLDFQSPPMRRINEVISRAAKSSATILITGESGTGKSVLARMIHDQSYRADKPFVTLSCPSLSKELLESELFGHAKGSFTGAIKDRWGKVTAAAGGTLFLDEIGDLPLEIQPKLLRLLQEREYERLGENETRHASIRVIAATNRDLKRRVADGTFREDLFFRLNVIEVEMPPLRDRHNDLQRFADHYLRHFSIECGRTMRELSTGLVSHMKIHSWPGNLRELRNSLQRAVILAKTDEIAEADLDLQTEGELYPEAGDRIPLKNVRESYVRKVLSQTGSIAAAAKVLKIDKATFYRMQKQWNREPALLEAVNC